MKKVFIILLGVILMLGILLIVNVPKRQTTVVEVADIDSTIQMVDTTLVLDSNFWHYQ